MADLTDAEIDALEGWASDPTLADPEHSRVPDFVSRLIAEVRRWRDQAADEAGLARLAAEIRARQE